MLYRITKRAFDLLFSMVAIVLSLALFLIIALLVKCTSRGPIFYKCTMLGSGLKPIVFYKFRTMYVDADQNSQMS